MNRHQTGREVLRSLDPVLVKHPEFGEHKIIEAFASRSARLSSECRGHVALGLI